MQYLEITQIRAREILDSRGFPTVEVDVICQKGEILGRASVPSGASTGSFEALELRDQNQNYYLGKGVKKAIANIHDKIVPALLGQNALNQRSIDEQLCSLDGSLNKSELGANASLGVSLAVAHAAAHGLRLPLFRYLGGVHSYQLPIPMMNIINGGRHANNHLDFQEFMIVCHGFPSYRQTLQAGSEIYHHLKKILNEKNYSIAVGDEGGFAPQKITTKQALDFIMQAIHRSSYQIDSEIQLAIDVAASEFYQAQEKTYYCRNLTEDQPSNKSVADMIQIYRDIANNYPLISIEDGIAEDDWDGWQQLSNELGKKMLLIGDDFLVTNKERLQKAIMQNSANAILIKTNQIGTLSETLDCIQLAHRNHWQTVISHRSGETEDATIAHLAVAANSPFIKSGAPCRSDRTSKYNMLLRIEENLGSVAKLQDLASLLLRS